MRTQRRDRPPGSGVVAGGVRARVAAGAGVIALAMLAGCSSPLAVQAERDLKRSVIDTVRREVGEAQRRSTPRETVREGGLSRLQIDARLIPDLERMAGPRSYEGAALPLDADLLGQPQGAVVVSMERVVRSAVENNLQIQFARLGPAISESQVVAAQAAFDTVLFGTGEWSNVDGRRAQAGAPGIEQRQTITSGLGLRRPLTSGGQVTLSQDLISNDVNSPGSTIRPNPANDLSYTLRFDQPLLRGFGSDVALAPVRLARNVERDQISQLKRDLIRTVTDTEQAYWRLVQARQELLIFQRLYERGVRVRDAVLARQDVDATPAQRADARARVERRRADVVRAQRALRDASDALKVLINDPDLPVGGEALLLPAEDPVDAPVRFSLADVLTTAIQKRPELQQAIISIDNTSIRQQVADNARLPRLDMRLQARFSGLADSVGDAFNEVAQREFIDYLVGFQFEQSLGNRQAEALMRQRRLERQQATIAYRNAVQQVILEVKRALRAVVTNYELIEQTRLSRLAETENLRSFEVEKEIIRGYDVNSLDLEFRRQEALAQAERDELEALVTYQTALAQLYAAMGTALERNGIELRVPEAGQTLDAGGIGSRRNPVSPRGESTPTLNPPRAAGPLAPGPWAPQGP